MNKSQIKQFLNQVADIEELKPKKIGSVRQDDDDITEIVYEGQPVIIDSKFNPTLGYKVKKIKPIVKECRLGCGRAIADQHIEFKLLGFPKKHWRTRCDNCQKYVSPCGEYLIDNIGALNSAYIKWFKSQDNK